MNGINTHGYKLASKGTRFLAFLVELILFSLLTFGVFLIIGKSISEYWNSDFEFIEILYSAITGLVVGAIFYPIFIGNLGHRIFKLKVISEETGKDFKKPEKGAIREFLKYVLGYLIIPVIWILWDKKNQNLYDKLTKTLVVENTQTNSNVLQTFV